MANCELCGIKLSFMGGESFLAGTEVHGVKIGETLFLCDNCAAVAKGAKSGNLPARIKLHDLAKASSLESRRKEAFLSYFGLFKTEEELAEEKRKAEEQQEEERLKQQLHEATLNSIREEISKYKERSVLLFDIDGCRGRNLKVYPDRVTITTDITLGSILTNNATDGQKTIFYHDVVGIQYKIPGLTIGYLQLETSSGQMNNLASNQFSENTFTFESDVATVELIKDYILYKVAQHKKADA